MAIFGQFSKLRAELDVIVYRQLKDVCKVPDFSQQLQVVSCILDFKGVQSIENILFIKIDGGMAVLYQIEKVSS